MELYGRLGGVVYATCRRIVGDAEDASEAASEAFWRVWRHARRFDPARRSALAWVLTIARRVALDRRRSARRYDAALKRLASGAPDPEPYAPYAVERERVRTALARLSAQDRALLEAAYFDGLTGLDIASRDSIPLGTVKSRMRAALARLRIVFARGVGWTDR